VGAKLAAAAVLCQVSCPRAGWLVQAHRSTQAAHSKKVVGVVVASPAGRYALVSSAFGAWLLGGSFTSAGTQRGRLRR